MRYPILIVFVLLSVLLAACSSPATNIVSATNPTSPPVPTPASHEMSMTTPAAQPSGSGSQPTPARRSSAGRSTRSARSTRACSRKSWTPRKQFYEHAQLYRYIAPGAVRIGATVDDKKLAVFAYRNPDGKVVIVGRSADAGAITVKGTFSSIKLSPTLAFTYTSPAQNLVKGASVAVNDSRTFSVTIPARCVFTLSSGQN